jgi:chorismate mutase
MNEMTEGGARRLKKWRREIDRIDNALLRLVSQRAAIACDLGAVKVAYGLPGYDGRRERQVLARMRAANQGPLSRESVGRIFHRIIVESRRIGIESMREQRRKSMAVRRLGQEQRNGH